MTAATVTLFIAVFGACSVEMVEALTIVVAAGTSRGWRSALEGAGAAIAILAVIVVAAGVPIVRYVPISALRVVVGTILLVMGESWLRKAVLRASGHKAKHDEDEIFTRTSAELNEDGRPAVRRDGVAFAVAFKGVFLEGVEVAIIVISVGGSQHRLGLAALAAGAAFFVVAGVGAVVARQLAGVPENLIKWGVGIMLTSLGLFWMGEGVGLRWPGNDLAIPVLVGVFLVTSLIAARLMKAVAPPPVALAAEGHA
ncbi:MAG: COG4280 domain-containing protein [Acidimicrobiales bacterium]